MLSYYLYYCRNIKQLSSPTALVTQWSSWRQDPAAPGVAVPTFLDVDFNTALGSPLEKTRPCTARVEVQELHWCMAGEMTCSKLGSTLPITSLRKENELQDYNNFHALYGLCSLWRTRKHFLCPLSSPSPVNCLQAFSCLFLLCPLSIAERLGPPHTGVVFFHTNKHITQPSLGNWSL